MYYNTCMDKVKEPSVANTFYSGNPSELKTQIESFIRESKNQYPISTRAVIVPHAGLIYSGRLAYEGISQLDRSVKNIFIFAPAHRVGFQGLGLTSYDRWKTPLGTIDVNQDITSELIEKFGANYNDDALAPEHSVEIQVPIIQYIFDDVKIIPVLLGQAEFQDVTKILEEYYPNPENGFIISSDLSHFLTNEEAYKLDHQTALMIESGNLSGFKYEMACGAIGIAGLVNFANNHKWSLVRIDMTNSSWATGDKSRVVGYGSWFLLEDDKNNFIKEYYSDFIIDLAKVVLQSAFDKEQRTIDYPQIMDEFGASFVTLEKNGMLRGCIGSIIAHQPLINDLVQNTRNAAFSDPRFNPLQFEELNELKIAVSILTAPTKIVFDNEEDLLNKIVPNKDGIIIKDGNYQAVYLPSVWEQIPDKKMFLNSLKVKAGLPETHFSNTFEAYRYETIYIKEE